MTNHGLVTHNQGNIRMLPGALGVSREPPSAIVRIALPLMTVSQVVSTVSGPWRLVVLSRAHSPFPSVR